VLCEDYRVRKVLNQSRLESVCIVWEFINGGVLLAIGQGVNVFYFIWGNKMQPNGSIWLSRLIWILDPFIVESRIICFLWYGINIFSFCRKQNSVLPQQTETQNMISNKFCFDTFCHLRNKIVHVGLIFVS
jgi:hypothetical protein